MFGLGGVQGRSPLESQPAMQAAGFTVAAFTPAGLAARFTNALRRDTHSLRAMHASPNPRPPEAAIDCRLMGRSRAARGGDGLRELAAAGVLRSCDLRGRVRLDLEGDFSGSGGGWGKRGPLGAVRCARASAEGSQQLGSACLSATAGIDALAPRGGMAWGVAVERKLCCRAGASGGGGGSGSGVVGSRGGGGSGDLPRGKLGARLFCERGFGRQLLLQAQRPLGASAWVDVRYALHARRGGRGAALRCSLLGGGDARAAAELSHLWRVGCASGGAGGCGGGASGGGGDYGSSSGGGGSRRAGGSSAVGCLGTSSTNSGGGGGASRSAPAPAPTLPRPAGLLSGAGVGPAPNAPLASATQESKSKHSASTSTGSTSSGSSGGAGAGGGILSTTAASSAAGAQRAAAILPPAPAQPTVPPPRPRWEVATACSYGAGGWGCSLELLLHRGERVTWEPLPGHALLS